MKLTPKQTRALERAIAERAALTIVPEEAEFAGLFKDTAGILRAEWRVPGKPGYWHTNLEGNDALYSGHPSYMPYSKLHA